MDVDGETSVVLVPAVRQAPLKNSQLPTPVPPTLLSVPVKSSVSSVWAWRPGAANRPATKVASARKRAKDFIAESSRDYR